MLAIYALFKQIMKSPAQTQAYTSTLYDQSWSRCEWLKNCMLRMVEKLQMLCETFNPLLDMPTSNVPIGCGGQVVEGFGLPI